MFPPHLEKIILNAQATTTTNATMRTTPATTTSTTTTTMPTAAGGPPPPPPPSLLLEDATNLPVPNHVTLNHLFALSVRDGVMGIASTVRYRKKYMTIVYYRPS